MQKLKFFEVDKGYIAYLKQFEEKIPAMAYASHDKFVCGVVLDINDMKYYAPISSFNKPQSTNFIILNESNNPIASIRFCFMFPAPPEVLTVKDFNSEEYKYKRLLMTELEYCNNNYDKILAKARQVYKIGMNANHPLASNCCNFRVLEEKCTEYVRQKSLSEASAVEENSITDKD